jgi:Mobilization protein NikA
MSIKTGRPRVLKAKKRDIFIVTRISSDENKAISKAIRRSGKSQSEWVRETLLSAGNDKA